MKTIQIQTGSTTGRDHVGRGNKQAVTGNQDCIIGFGLAPDGNEIMDSEKNPDGYAVVTDENPVVIVITDGNGSKELSVLGSNWGAQVIVGAVRRAWRRRSADEAFNPEAFFETVRQDLLERFRRIIEDIRDTTVNPGATSGPGRERYLEIIRSSLIFSFIGLFITPKDTYVFGIGDGEYAVNGEYQVLGPFAYGDRSNAPPALVYELIGGYREHPERLKFQIYRVIPTSELQSAFVASDGAKDFRKNESSKPPGKAAGESVGPISQFWNTDPNVFVGGWNALNSTLNGMNRDVASVAFEPAGEGAGADQRGEPYLSWEYGLLRDDTTMAGVIVCPES